MSSENVTKSIGVCEFGQIAGIVSFEDITHLFLVFLLLTLNKKKLVRLQAIIQVTKWMPKKVKGNLRVSTLHTKVPDNTVF